MARRRRGLPVNGVVLLDSGDQMLWCNQMASEHLSLRSAADKGLRVTNLVRAPGLAAQRTTAKMETRQGPRMRGACAMVADDDGTGE